jgi:hypothetical protein
MIVGKVVTHLCPTLFIKELKFSVEHDRVVTTLNIIFSVVGSGSGVMLREEGRNSTPDEEDCHLCRIFSITHLSERDTKSRD